MATIKTQNDAESADFGIDFAFNKKKNDRKW